MKAIWLLVAYLPVGLAFLFAFLLLVKGMSLLKTILVLWMILIGSYFFLTFLLPVTLAQLNRPFFSEILYSFPEPTMVVAMAAFGWAYAATIALCAFVIIWIFRKMFVRRRQP
jgi:hypothetical protein